MVIENTRVDEIEDGTAIESRNGSVRTWALELFDRYRKESEELTVESLS
ncbi:MAG: hypothetical protein R3324_15480 [Halobacteriales archaeon]|nr:hypothetical protein [Halobacteriales archaeon]